MVEIKKILFPIDSTENSFKILPYVLSVSERYNSMIYLLHVVPDLHRWGKLYMPHTAMDKFQEEAMEGAKKAIDTVCEEQLESRPNFQRRVVSGDPATEILKIIGSEGIDLVIMGTHGRKGLEHVIFGSVAENVVKQSPVPVLIINPHKLKFGIFEKLFPPYITDGSSSGIIRNRDREKKTIWNSMPIRSGNL